MKPKKCRLILHGLFKEHDMGIFQSIAKAKKFVKDCWSRPYSIIILEETK
jgi:hypothetical protein